MSDEFNLKDLLSYGDDLINLLNKRNGFDVVSHSFEHLQTLNSTCDQDFNQTQESIKECKKKLDACKKKTEEANATIEVADEIERLQRELNEEMEVECRLKDELRVVADELKELNAQRILIDEQRECLKRKKRDDLRAEKKLSMYASVTKVIPEIGDTSKISGYMVDREKRVIEKFQFETNTMTDYEACNSVWSIIKKQ